MRLLVPRAPASSQNANLKTDFPLLFFSQIEKIFLDFPKKAYYTVQADKLTASFLSNTEMSRSWSSAHDWKSCKGQKLFESSNLSISAMKKIPHHRWGIFFISVWRDSNYVRKPHRWLASTSANTGRFLFFFARAAARPKFSLPLRKNARESLHLHHKSTLILIESEYFSFPQKPQ